MSPDEVARTSYSKFWKGVRKNHVNIQSKFQLCGFDTETSYGQVFAMGFTNGETYKMFYGTHRNYFYDLLDSLFALPNQKKTTIVCAAHYLPFDLGVLLWPIVSGGNNFKRRGRAPKQLHFSVPKYRCEIFAAMGKPCFMRVRRGKVTYHIIDTFSFFGVSLDRALKTIGGTVQKMEKPHLLGKRVIPRKEVEPYLKADVLGVHDLLKHVISLHDEYKARLCVSLPQLAGRIFRHAYMKKDFVRLPVPVLIGSLLSYHGGKNTFVGKPGWYKGVWDLDIRSAYPEAMRQLPNFEAGSWIETKKLKTALRNKHGVYKVSGRAKKCPWGILFTHEFKKIEGDFEDVWITGYELIEAVKTGEVKFDRVTGYYFKDDGGESAFTKFVDEFFHLKQTAEDKVKRQFYKLILNSLYGKFIQRNEKENGMREAGAMFDPAVASLITGYVRAKIHALEHRYKSLHTATDGFLTSIRPDPRDIGEKLGQLTQENFGDCLIIRNKLYLHYNQKGELHKKGLHGYQGSAEELIELWKKKKSEYTVERLVGWAEAWHIGMVPGFPRQKVMQLNHANLK